MSRIMLFQVDLRLELNALEYSDWGRCLHFGSPTGIDFLNR